MSRADRVAELIKHEVSDIIARKLNDPRIGFTSITKVEIGSDLLNANIYISVLGSEEEQKLTMAGLEHARKFVRSELGHRMQLREVPEVHFKQDRSLEKAAKVFEIMHVLEKEKHAKGHKRAQKS